MSDQSFDAFTELEEAIRDMQFLAEMLLELGIMSDRRPHNIYFYAGRRLSDHAERAKEAFEGLHEERAARHNGNGATLSVAPRAARSH